MTKKKRYNTVSIRPIQIARARASAEARSNASPPDAKTVVLDVARASHASHTNSSRDQYHAYTHRRNHTREHAAHEHTRARNQINPRASREKFKFFKPIAIESRTNFLPILAVIKRNRAAKELILRTKTSSISSSNASTPIRVASHSVVAHTNHSSSTAQIQIQKNAPLPESIHPWRFVASDRQFSYHSQHARSVRISMHIFHRPHRAHRATRAHIARRTHRNPPAVAPRAAPHTRR